MACPNCNCSMDAIMTRFFYCSRCGTLKEFVENSECVTTPLIIDQVRESIYLHGKSIDASVVLARKMGLLEGMLKPRNPSPPLDTPDRQ
jgi:hypothetical protein